MEEEKTIQLVKTIDAFCADLQEIAPHTVVVDDNLDYIFTSPSGRFFKIPSDADVLEYLKKHEEANKNQIKTEDVEAAKAALLAKI